MARPSIALCITTLVLALLLGCCPSDAPDVIDRTSSTDGNSSNENMMTGDVDLTYMWNPDATSVIAGYIQGSEGNTLAVFADKDSQGDPSRVTGAYFRLADGSEWSTFLGSDGLPSIMVVADFVFEYTNYANGKVDVACTFPDGTRQTQIGIPTDPELVAFLKDARTASESGTFAKVWQEAHGKKDAQCKVTVSQILRVSSAALSLATCVAAIATSAGITAGSAFTAIPGGIALTIVGCSGAVISTINLFVDNETLSDASTGIAIVQCGNHNCEPLIRNIAIRVVEHVERSEEAEHQDSDGDGVPDNQDGCPTDPNKTFPDACGCGQPDRPNCSPGDRFVDRAHGPFENDQRVIGPPDGQNANIGEPYKAGAFSLRCEFDNMIIDGPGPDLRIYDLSSIYDGEPSLTISLDGTRQESVTYSELIAKRVQTTDETTRIDLDLGEYFADLGNGYHTLSLRFDIFEETMGRSCGLGVCFTNYSNGFVDAIEVLHGDAQ